ncbi:MAG TPA: D-aminoacyl-tRNA deacylase [Clostridiales bacterium]|nr:D-aminoacyl-tRNA deacylase [Clostridiales bacterium]
MKAVIQRVSEAAVSVDGQVISAIQNGFLVLLGIQDTDEKADAEVLAKKIAHLRIFEDEDGKMNLSLLDLHYGCLVISQFTLLADTKKGNRPSFTQAARPEKAIPLYEFFLEQLQKNGIEPVEHGCFGADMKVQLVNDGPVTISYDSKQWVKA